MAKTTLRYVEAPETLLAIDPGAAWPGGKRNDHRPYAGCALFRRGALAWASLVKCPEGVPLFARPNRLVREVCVEAGIKRDGGLTMLAVENPLIYPHSEARPQDIVALKGIYGAFMGGIDADFYSGPAPADVKSNVDKETMNERTLAILKIPERNLLKEAQKAGRGGLSDHTLDGVGLGLFVLGRMGVGGIA
jgi:hypothetical protein